MHLHCPVVILQHLLPDLDGIASHSWSPFGLSLTQLNHRAEPDMAPSSAWMLPAVHAGLHVLAVSDMVL